MHPCIYLCIYLDTDLSVYLSTHLSIYVSIAKSVYLSILLSIYRSLLSSFCSFNISICLCIHLSISHVPATKSAVRDSKALCLPPNQHVSQAHQRLRWNNAPNCCACHGIQHASTQSAAHTTGVGRIAPKCCACHSK